MQSYFDYGAAREFFNRFNVTLTTPTRAPLKTTYADFKTGKTVSGYIPPNATAQSTALKNYLKQVERYEDIFLPGFWNFPTQFPPELLLPFSDFAKKYDIEAAIPQMLTVGGLGIGDPKTSPTFLVMQTLGAPVVRSLLSGSLSFVPASHNNSELYSRIAGNLKDDILYFTVVVDAERSENGVKLTLKGEDGVLIHVHAKRLLITFAPTMQNMAPLRPDELETSIFSKWEYYKAYPGFVIHPSLPVNGSIINIPELAVPSNYLEIPGMPYIGRFSYVGNPGFRVIIGGNGTFNSMEAKKTVEKALLQMIEGGTLPSTEPAEKLKFTVLGDHGAMHLHVSPKELEDGFMPALYKLQGRNSTWYSGAAWSSQYTTVVWAFTDTVLPRLLEGL